VSDLTGLIVFLVEDEPIIAFDLRVMLEEAGAEVVGPALTIQQAQEFVSDPMSVAVLDVRLGDQNIFPIACRLCERGIPIIFHTGHGSAEKLVGRWPGSKVLIKPVRSDMLLSTIALMSPARA
jgi:DNA-binding response OmpR family regulator